MGIRDAWRKNSPELLGVCNGALPRFVTAPRVRERLEGVPVFAYHLIESAELEADLGFLHANGYQTLTASQFIDYLSGTYVPEGPAVLLSFDDGPRNFYTTVFPLLRRFGAHAVAFVAPGLHAGDEGPEPCSRPMTWAEIEQVHASGLVEFHSHTLESRFVPRWPAIAPLAGCDPNLECRRRGAPRTLSEDLSLSRALLQAHLPGARSDQLAFPMYEGTPAAIAAAQAAGFRACYWGLVPGRPLNNPGDSPFHISRMSHEFLRRLPGRGRITLSQLLGVRLRKVRQGREWRRLHPPVADSVA